MNSSVKALKKKLCELYLLNELGTSNSASEMLKTRKQQKFIIFSLLLPAVDPTSQILEVNEYI